jgi:cobalt/nickel transport system permease protein
MGILSAIVFVAQMLNFPLLIGPVTGHLLGAALSTLVLGPWSAILVMTAVLFVQALFFADGGLLVLGANILNMGILGVFSTEIIRRGLNIIKEGKRSLFLTGFATGFFGVVSAALGAFIALILSNQFPDPIFGLTIVLFWHFLIGLGEGMITAGVLLYLWKIEFPLEQLDGEKVVEDSVTRWNSQVIPLLENKRAILGVVVILSVFSILAIIPSYFDFQPDGLEYVGSEEIGFQRLIANISGAFSLGLADDYDFLNLGSVFGTLLASIFGISLIIIFFYCSIRIIGLYRNRERKRSIDTLHFHTHEIELKSSIRISDTKSKFIITIITVLALSFIVSYSSLIVIYLFTLLVALFYYRPSFRAVLMKMIFPLPLIVSLAILSLVSRPDIFVFSNGLFSSTFTNVSFALFQTLRSFLIVFVVLSFIEGEDSFYEVIYALDELYIPRLFNNLLFLMYRSIFITQEELRRIREARYNRYNITPSYLSWTNLKITGNIIAGLIARSLNRSENIADNLSARGFQMKFPHEPKKWTGIGIGLCLFSLIFNVLVIFI